ncbi:MAG: lipoyl(octanoyl) transferase LipB [Gammaproteobacteria bacterium]
MPKARYLGQQDYQIVHKQMHEFTDARDENTCDEIWFVQHAPVFTLGRNGDKNNFLIDSDIPLIHSDRGGDVTYHGPGQLLVYCLMDLKRLQLGVKSLVYGLEEVIIKYLSECDVVGERVKRAPGVYVNGDKLASLGLRVRKGCSFHGLSINVNMDINPFTYINPCGLEGMQVTQLSQLNINKSCDEVASALSNLIVKQFYQ